MATIFLDVAGDSQGIPITIGRARMQRLAKHWHYVLRSRRRCIDDDALRETIEKRAADHLASGDRGGQEHPAGSSSEAC